VNREEKQKNEQNESSKQDVSASREKRVDYDEARDFVGSSVCKRQSKQTATQAKGKKIDGSERYKRNKDKSANITMYRSREWL